jgi:hypothetical protein
MNRTPLHCSVCTPEQLKSLTSNLATSLAFRFLHPADEPDRENAFDGLVALCWKAKGNLYIPARVWERLPSIARAGEDSPGEVRYGGTLYACTREFIEDFVLEYFARYHGASEEQILDAALHDRFRYIGRRLYSRMIDEIQKRSANHEPVPNRFIPDADGNEVVVAGDRPESVSVTPDYVSMLADAPGRTNFSTPLEFIRAREPSLTDALGGKNYAVLEAQAEAFPAAFEGTDQAAKSALTRAIARRRAVSLVQARADKRQLLAEVSEEMRRGNCDLNDLHTFLARGDDEHTLRQDYISGDGRRRRSIRMRIILPREHK